MNKNSYRKVTQNDFRSKHKCIRLRFYHSPRPEVFCKKAALKNFAIYRSLIFDKVAA